MQKSIVKFPLIQQLAGFSYRTHRVIERSNAIAKIGPLVEEFHQDNWGDKLLYRRNPGQTYCVHTTRRKGDREEYHYFIGEEVERLDFMCMQPRGFDVSWLLSGNYVKFTSEAGPVQEVRVDMWGKIGKMTSEDFGSERMYMADFEVHDERALDPENAIIDIYIGVMDKALYLERKAKASGK